MKKFFVSMLFFMATVSGAVSAASTAKAMIIFDASGSMWGQIDGVNKIVIARDALKSVVQKWNPKVALGLTVYGHRVKGDCNDIQTIIPIGKVDKKQMIDTVFSIQPKGMTPIAKSLRKVANTLRSNEGQTTIILISDGRESCEEDPCATAKQLKAEGINFVAHVVGFNVGVEADRQLSCIAKATGGEYFSAKNAAALNRAIRTIAKKVEKPKPKSKPVAIKKTTLELIARYQMNPKGLNVSGMKWSAVQDGKTLYEGSDEAPKVPAKVGKVHIKANYSRTSEPQSVEGDVALKPKKNNTVTIQLKSGKVIIDTAEEQGSPKVKSSVHIYPILDGQPNMDDEITWCIPTKSEACDRILPIGDFLLTASYNGMKVEKRITLKNKETKKIHLYFRQTGKVAISASETKDGKWVRGYIATIRNAEGERIKGGYYTGKKKPEIFQLPVGKYSFDMKYNEFKKENIPFEIKAGETAKVHVVMGSTGKVEISASETEGGKWVRGYIATIRNAEGERIKGGYYTGKKKPEIFQLPVGKYSFDMKYNEFKKENIPFEIKAGETAKVHVVFEQFRIMTKCKDMSAEVSYEIYADDGRVVYETRQPCSKAVRLSLDKGSYTVEASIGNDKVVQKFTIGGGVSTLTLDMTNMHHEAEIKADTSSGSAEVSKNPSEPTKKKSGAIVIDGKEIEIKGLSKKDAEEIQNLGAVIGAFSKMLGGIQDEAKKKDAAKEATEQKPDNSKADKAFDEMSQELEMFTK